MFLTLAQNVGLILAAALMQRFIRDRWPAAPPRGQVMSGLLFGAAAVMAMSLAYTLQSGVIFDARTVVLSTGALFGGAVVGVVSGIIAVVYRVFYIGGAGAWVGVAVIITAIAAGCGMRYACHGRIAALRYWQFLALGLFVHVLVVFWFAFLPLDYLSDIILGLAPVYIPLLTLATLLMSLVLRELDAIRDYERALLESRARVQYLFENAGVAIYDEDFSGLLEALSALRDSGVSDIRRYLSEWPDEIDNLASLIKVVQVNPAAVALFAVKSRTELLGSVNHFFSDDARRMFVDELDALWKGEEAFQAEATFIRTDGSSVDAMIAMPIPQTAEAAQHVPVSLVDMTLVRSKERQLQREKQSLEEVIWGTGVGTWEWNIVTGETIFNERWANIIGYTLDEISPTTLETWTRLAHPEDLVRSNHALSRVFSRETTAYECDVRMRHRNGEWIWVLDRGLVVEWDADGKPLRMSGTHLDITARKHAEQRASRLAGMRQVLLCCHADLLSADSEDALFFRTAETLVRERYYALTWVGIPRDDARKRVEPVAVAGEAAQYMEGFEALWSDTPLGRGPAGTVVRSGQPLVIRNLALEDAFTPWADRAARAGLRTMMAAPIPREEHDRPAILCLYSRSDDAFDDDEQAMVIQLSRSLALAWRSLRLQDQRLCAVSTSSTPAEGAPT
ncbi:MAG: PAS domain-containing protein [Chromatocurvus sp.]